MEIIALTVSVNYDDILKHIIEQNSKFFLKWFIVTSPEDTKTIELIESFRKDNIEILIYNDFYKNHSKFNKGGAVLFGQTHIETVYSSANILILDSDIYLPDNFLSKLPDSIAEDTIYSTYNRSDYFTLNNFINDIPNCVWKNEFYGYFQLYKMNNKYLYSDSFNCAACDDEFRDKFQTRIIVDMRLKHLGGNMRNWNGRNYDDGVF
jgi:hypothetical protein